VVISGRANSGAEITTMTKPKQIGEPKFTAKQVAAKDCPASLKKLANEIAEYKKQAEQADTQAAQHREKASNNWEQVGKRLWEAKHLCSKEGFAEFRKLYCPVNKSRLSELLMLGEGTRSVAETRAATSARVAKHRANKAEAASVTTTDVTENTPAPAKPMLRAVTTEDTALVEFNGLVGRLLQITTQRPERFAKTAHSANELGKLGIFFTELVALKQSSELKEVA
jgi:hypothetical protein